MRRVIMLGIIGAMAACISGCKITGAPLSGGVQTVILTPAGTLARLPNRQLTIREPSGDVQEVTTDDDGLAVFPLAGPETDYLIEIEVSRGTIRRVWNGYSQIIVFVVYDIVENELQAVEVRK